MNYNKTWHYDLESFPTFFCATFMEDTSREVVQFAIGCGHNQLAELKSFITNNKHNLLVGFNSISYDDAVLRFILKSYTGKKMAKVMAAEIFELSKKLVNDAFRSDEQIRVLRYPKKWEGDVIPTSMDLFKIMHFDRLGVSLKQVAINLKHERIQDLPYPYNYPISTDEEVENVMSYNINDVIITCKLFHAIQPQIQLREEIGRLYNVDVMNASDSKMGNVILAHYYENDMGISVKELKDKRTFRDKILLGECIPSVIQFQTEELQQLRNEISSTTVYAPKYDFKKEILYKGTWYSLGIGGIHSMEGACRFDETEDTEIISCDIGSMYPTCIIINDIYPEHLGHDFVSVLSTLAAERLASKKTNKVKADALKITVNGLYGKLNSDTFWLQDAKAMCRVTIAGQLYILMLVEMLELAGIHCISANTDGIECQVKRDMESLYYEICKKWEEITGFMLEYIKYSKYIKRDVNNYIAVSTDGKVKTKGAFISDIDLKKGYKHPIIPKAVDEYFINGIPVEETIRACKDIMDFCISQKTGRDFQMELVSLSSGLSDPKEAIDIVKIKFLETHGWHHVNAGLWLQNRDTDTRNCLTLNEAYDTCYKQIELSEKSVKVRTLQKNNRFFISHANSRLQKNDGKKVIGLFVGHGVTLLNDYNPSDPFETYDVNLEWYIREAKDFIEEIEPSAVQLDMFGMDGSFGKRTKMNVDESKMTVRKTKLTKNTALEVRSANKTRATYNIGADHFLVISVNTTYSPVLELYSLSKGTTNKIKVPQDVYDGCPLFMTDVIVVEKFKKRPKTKPQGKKFVEIGGEEWWLTNYQIVSDVTSFERKDI